MFDWFKKLFGKKNEMNTPVEGESSEQSPMEEMPTEEAPMEEASQEDETSNSEE